MEILIFIGIILMSIILFIFFKKNPLSTSNKENIQKNILIEKEYHYVRKPYFFTKNELYFYRDLQTATEDMNVVIFSKVRLADIIEPKNGSKNWQGSFSKIKSKHIDFILCSLPNIIPILAIELDDNSHNTAKRQERDNFIDISFKSVNLPILHIKGSAGLKDKITEKIK